MSATIEATSVPRRFRVWCEQCQDGVNYGRAAAVRWMDTHNAKNHPGVAA